MAKGFTGIILRVDLSTGKTERLALSEEFYRTYMGGSGFGAYFLLKEVKTKTDPFAPENIVTIAPGITTGAAISGVSHGFEIQNQTTCGKISYISSRDPEYIWSSSCTRF